jgi:LPS O-antigen subunit length determinant protein (WzzB/FepE family)
LEPSEAQTYRELDIRTVLNALSAAKQTLISKKITLIISSLIFGAVATGIAFLMPVYYVAESSFMAEESNKNGGLGGMVNIASQLGIGGGPAKDNTEKILDLIKSRRIFESTMMDSAKIDGIQDVLINHYLRVSNWGQKLTQQDEFRNFKYDAAKPFTRTHDSIMQVLHFQFNKTLIESETKKTSTLLKLKVKTEHEVFSQKFNRSLLQNLNLYYIATTVAKQKNMFEILEGRADSLRTEIEMNERMMAKSNDENIHAFKMEPRIDMVRLKREITTLNLVYGEVIKNLEMARANLLNETPVLSVIDEPALPLEKEKPAKKIWLIGGMIAGLVLSSLWILLAQWWRKVTAPIDVESYQI